MRVTSSGKWAIASRDLFRAGRCEHCIRLSMAVEAKVPEVLERVNDYREDLDSKLPIIQGNQREKAVFEQIRKSLPVGEFIELSGAKTQNTIDAMLAKTPVIAQGYFESNLTEYEWSGYADLLVLEGYDIVQGINGEIQAVQVGNTPDQPRYVPWDVKNSSEGKPKYPVQLASYLQALNDLELASKEPIGIVLGFAKGIVKYETQESLNLYRQSLSSLLSILDQAKPESIHEGFIDDWACAKKSMCVEVFCDYPSLCKEIFKKKRALELLPRVHHTHVPKLVSAGFPNVTTLAACDAPPVVEDLKAEFVDRYWASAKVMQLEFENQPALMSKTSGSPDLPSESEMDLFFDIEWFNPVDASAEFIFMFGAVGSDESFEVFVSEKVDQELGQLDKFLDFAMSKFNVDNEMHIYHFSNPEPKKLDQLSQRYGGHRHEDVQTLISRMIDLRDIAEATFIPGSGSYSIKSLEKYYDADSKLNRGGLVLGGADAMYQFELFRVEAFERGNLKRAREIMRAISEYNKDDCLSTKLLCDWLRSLTFESAGQIMKIMKPGSV